jgi:hypothetical protein
MGASNNGKSGRDMSEILTAMLLLTFSETVAVPDLKGKLISPYLANRNNACPGRLQIYIKIRTPGSRHEHLP